MENNEFQSLLHNMLDMDQTAKFLKKKTAKFLKESSGENVYVVRIGRDFLDHRKN